MLTNTFAFFHVFCESFHSLGTQTKQKNGKSKNPKIRQWCKFRIFMGFITYSRPKPIFQFPYKMYKDVTPVFTDFVFDGINISFLFGAIMTFK